MPVTPDITADFAQVADGLETVVHVRRDQSDGAELAHCLRRAVTVREAEASGGRYTALDVTWHIPVAVLAEAPGLGDTLTDSGGGVWTVLAVRQETLKSRWACTCRELRIAAGLTERIKIQRTAWSKGTAGALTAAWSELHVLVDLPARIQPHQGQVALEHGRRLLRITHMVYVARPVDVDDNHRVLAADGSAYRVVAYQRPERIDALPVIHVVAG